LRRNGCLKHEADQPLSNQFRGRAWFNVYGAPDTPFVLTDTLSDCSYSGGAELEALVDSKRVLAVVVVRLCRYETAHVLTASQLIRRHGRTKGGARFPVRDRRRRAILLVAVAEHLTRCRRRARAAARACTRAATRARACARVSVGAGAAGAAAAAVAGSSGRSVRAAARPEACQIRTQDQAGHLHADSLHLVARYSKSVSAEHGGRTAWPRDATAVSARRAAAAAATDDEF